jgi:hypothetical protein
MERIERSVQRELGRGAGGRAEALPELTATWPAAVGEHVARNAWPLRIGRDGTLHVATASATWALELDRLGPEILAKLAASLGEAAPAKIRFAVGPLPEPGAEEPPAPLSAPPPDVPPEVAADAVAAASEIEDPELRELALRAARASLAKPPSDRGF